MNLATAQKLIKPALVIGAVVFVFIFLVFLIFLRYFDPGKPPAGTQGSPAPVFDILPYPQFIPEPLQRKAGSITVSIQNDPSIPQDNLGNVYKLEKIDPATKATGIAKILGLAAQPSQSPLFELWTSGRKKLTLEKESARLTYSVPFSQKQNRTVFVGNDAVNVAGSWLAQLSLEVPNPTTTVQPLKVQGSNFVGENDTGKAQAYEVDFFEKLDEFPVVGQSPKTGAITIFIDQEGELLKLETVLASPNTELVGKYPIISPSQASQEVNVHGIIVEAEIAGSDPLVEETVDISSINLTSVEYAYFKNIQDNFLMPIYIFRGEAQFQDERSGSAVVYLPAIENQYLK